MRAGQERLSLRHSLVGAVLAVALAASDAHAHEGHDHGDAASAPVSSAAPHRLPDGALVVPKRTQRQIGVRTVIAERGASARAIELPGRVAVDPNAAGRVQATVPGRIEAGPGGLPAVGQTVARGQVLAVVRASIDPVQRAAQRAQIAELEETLALAVRRAARLRDLSDTVPRKDIEAADSDVASLRARLAALATGVSPGEPLRAPLAGVVASTSVVSGQVVESRDVLFEIIDPTRLRIEATGFDASLAGEVVDGSVGIRGTPVALAFVGAGRVLREQALPLVFRARDPRLTDLAVGQPVAVTVRLRGTMPGVALPATALTRNAANETIVWVKTQAERFVPRTVRIRHLDATRVLVTDGLSGGERIVTDGAPLLAQIR
jgi:cobalt-zinc-cadmium efflux system membrane fusion protein